MKHSEEAKLLYLKSLFKNIDEFKADEVYKSRANFLGTVFKGINEDNEIKRNRWFNLLRIANEIIQYELQDEKQEEEIVKELMEHPYFKIYKGKEFLLNILNHRKQFKATLKEFDDETAKIYYGLFHLHQEVQTSAVNATEELLADDAKALKFGNSVKIFQKKLPALFKEYGELFQICISRVEPKKVTKKRTFNKTLQNIPWYLYLIIILIIFKIIRSLNDS